MSSEVLALGGPGVTRDSMRQDYIIRLTGGGIWHAMVQNGGPEVSERLGRAMSGPLARTIGSTSIVMRPAVQGDGVLSEDPRVVQRALFDAELTGRGERKTEVTINPPVYDGDALARYLIFLAGEMDSTLS